MQTALQHLREDITLSVLLTESTKTIVCALIDNHLESEKDELIAMCSIGSRNPGIEGEKVFETKYKEKR